MMEAKGISRLGGQIQTFCEDGRNLFENPLRALVLFIGSIFIYSDP